MERRGLGRRLREMGMTHFQTDVLLALTRVPRGSTVSYKQLAAMAGHPGAYRAVGTVMRKNPLAPTIPCHRVIKSDGTLGNYSGRGGARRKMVLLASEGASVKGR